MRAGQQWTAARDYGAHGGGGRGLTVPRPRVPTPVPAPSAPSGLSDDAVLHLLRRTTYGATPELVAQVRRLGPQVWLEQQLDPASLPDPVCDAVLTRLPLASMTAAQLRAELDVGAWDAMQEVVMATIVRSAWSTRQLFEVVVDFWSNHLNVTCPSSDVWDTRGVEDREVVRRHALGRYSDMLVASATSPSMLRYLDGASSRKSAPNENYGRELLELHTVGVGAGYTEADVRASALALTGFTVDDATGLFRFRSDWHHVGPLRVMGWSSANSTAAGGRAVGESYLRYLASHPATATRLATKLCLRFVSDSPPASLVSRLAATYLAHDTAIVPVLRELLTSPEFAASVGQKTRRPYEDLVATLRVLGIGPGTGVEGLWGLRWMAEDRAHAPLGWHPPNGYPDVAAAWQGAGGTVTTWQGQMSLAAGWWPDALDHPGAQSLLPTPRPTTCGGLVDALSLRLLGQVLPADERAALLGFLERPEGDPPHEQHLGWQLPYLVSLVLATPTWSRR